MTPRTAIITSTTTLMIGMIGGFSLKPHLPGDADGNGVVDFQDINSVNANWGAAAPLPTPFDGARLYTLADWTVAGPNRCALIVWGESEDWQAMTGADYKGANWTLVRPSEAMSGEEAQ